MTRSSVIFRCCSTGFSFQPEAARAARAASSRCRRWLTPRHAPGHDGAVAAMMTLLMGMRCIEVVSRIVRDIDDDGTLPWISDSKTEKGKRTLRIPEPLRPYLRDLAEGRPAGELLFGLHDRGWPRHWAQRICEEAGVPRVTAHGQRRAFHACRRGGRNVARSRTHSVTSRSRPPRGAMPVPRQWRTHGRSTLRVLDGGKARAA